MTTRVLLASVRRHGGRRRPRARDRARRGRATSGTTHGRRYLDGTASLWHAHVGHGREEIAEAIARAAADARGLPDVRRRREPAGARARRAPRRALADGRTRASSCASAAATRSTPRPSSRASTGRAVGQPERIHLISRTYAYHGTHGFGTSLVGMEPMRQGYGPLVGSVSHVATTSPEALEAEIERVGADQRRGVLLRAGDRRRRRPPARPRATSRPSRRSASATACCSSIDSVICAFGRLGTWLGYERWDIEPDMVVLAKGITSGYLPLGARPRRRRDRRAVLARAGRRRCSATARPTPATRRAARPRSRTSTSSSARG